MRSYLIPRMADTPVLLEPGLYSFNMTAGEILARMHLRVDPDGGGLLMCNASEAAHLSPSGVVMAHRIMRGDTREAIQAELKSVYQDMTDEDFERDYTQLSQIMIDLATPDTRYPVTSYQGLGEDGQPRRLLAPFKACVRQGPMNIMKPILQSLWEDGFPQVSILVDPAQDVQELPQIVECAEDLGMITGLRLVASWVPLDIITACGKAGLDSLSVVFAGANAATHDAATVDGDFEALWKLLAHCTGLEFCCIVEIPVWGDNEIQIEAMMMRLKNEIINNISVYVLTCPDEDEVAREVGAIPARALPQIATTCSEEADANRLVMTWDAPVRWNVKKTLQEHIYTGPRANGAVSVRVEADGSVYPARGGSECVGNVLRQPWPEIWKKPCFAQYREGTQSAKRCAECPELGMCINGCIKDPASWSDDTGGVA